MSAVTVMAMMTNLSGVEVPYSATHVITPRVDGQIDYITWYWEDREFVEQWHYDEDDVFIGADIPTAAEE